MKFALVFAIAATAVFAHQDDPLVSPYVTVPPVIDGDLSDWNESDFVFVDARTGVTETGSRLDDDPADLSFSFGVANDDRYLYVAVRVVDDVLVLDSNRDPSDVAAQPWMDDAVEIFLDGDHSHSPDARDPDGVEFETGGEFAITANGAATSDQSGVPSSGGDPGVWEYATSYPGPPAAAYESPWDTEIGGYTVEVRFDITGTMGGAARPGSIIGFTVSAHDDDNGDAREAALYWKAVVRDPWKDEAAWGALQLSAQPGAQPPPPAGAHALRSDIRVTRITDVPRGTVRIARDPLDSDLYTMTTSGAISRVNLLDRSTQTVYTSADHGVRSTLGFTIGPDGAFYLTFNRTGDRSTFVDRIVQGILDESSGVRQWSSFDPGDPPVGAPIEDILAVGASETRLARDPDNTLHTMKPNGDITRGVVNVIYSAADHGVGGDSVGGFLIGPDGTFYITANRTLDLTTSNIAGIVKGVVDPLTGERAWSLHAETAPYPLSDTNFDHIVNGVVVSPDNRWIYFNSGSRTDHGEVQDNGGAFPGVREVPLTSAILRVPVDGGGIRLPADEASLRDGGYLFADGVRNTFDLRFAPNGDLFGAENGPDRDHFDELNWLREGHHYGFPWRMGNTDNPQQFPGYDPASDRAFIPDGSAAFARGTFYDDPDYPPRPSQSLTDPVVNFGPDADRFRDPETGLVRDASDLGLSTSTFTPHRSPLGLVFDESGKLSSEFRGDGFILSIGGDCCDLIDPFGDPDEDLVHLDLVKRGDRYETRATRLVAGFRGPIDAEIIDNRIYVVEFSGGRGLWEVALPTSTATAVVEAQTTPSTVELYQNYPNPFNSSTVYRFATSTRQRVELTVFDLLGQRVARLVDADMDGGIHTVRWDGRNDAGGKLASGIYVSVLRTETRFVARKVLLLR